jgi:hypothetical protein
MTRSRNGTEEGSGREKVKGEQKVSGGNGMWLLPVLLAIPFAAAMIFAAMKYGGQVQNLIHVAIKLVVIK